MWNEELRGFLVLKYSTVNFIIKINNGRIKLNAIFVGNYRNNGKKRERGKWHGDIRQTWPYHRPL
jgi:hypothetical protein